LIVALTLASACGLMIALVAQLGWQNHLLSIIVGLSMFLGMNVAIIISTSLPFLFNKLKLDPAFASGPFATMVSDVATITIYFVTALVILTNARV
jgi:magnesium transporter